MAAQCSTGSSGPLWHSSCLSSSWYSPMPRPQFTLKTMLWLMALVGAFCAGVRWERRQIGWEHKAMRRELSALKDGQMADTYTIVGYQRVLKKHGIDESEVNEALDATV